MRTISSSLTLLFALQITLCRAWKANQRPKMFPAEMFEIDPSLEVKVWAITPMLYNPTNMDIDHRAGG